MRRDRLIDDRPRRGIRGRPSGLATLCALVAALAVFSAPSPAPAFSLPGAARAHPGLPPQGIYESCPAAKMLATCEARLDVMRSAGLSVVLNGSLGDAPRSVLAAYADHAQQIGMKVMWELGDPGFWNGQGAVGDYPLYAGECGCTDTSSLLSNLVGFLATLPATYGYYVADDSAYSSADQLATIHGFADQVRSLDPKHATVVAVAGWPSRPAETVADAEAVELYPYGLGLSDPLRRVSRGAAAASHAARAAGRPTVLVLQAFNWGDNIWDGNAMGKCSLDDAPGACAARLPYPSASAQMAMRDAAISANPGLILWYDFQSTYGYAEDPGTGYAPPSAAEAATRWAGLKAAIQAPQHSVASSARARARSARAHTSRPRRHPGRRRHRRHRRHR